MKKVLLFAIAFISVCAKAQVYPLSDAFETYADNTPLGTQAGYNSNMVIHELHGVNNSKGVVADMNSTNTVDSLLTPVIGPLTTSSVFSVQYRIMQSAGYPANAAVLDSGDKVEVWGKIDSQSNYSLVEIIDPTNQNPTTNFQTISFSGGDAAGNNVDILIKVTHGSSTDFLVDFDSLQLTDQPHGLIIKPAASNPTCNGSANGSISLYINGGTAPYTYNWSNTLNSVSSQQNLAAGTYSVTVWDNAGRSATASITLSQPEPVTLSTSVTDASCNGLEDGGADVTVHSGIAPFTYLWSNNTQNETLSNVHAGVYAVLVKDATECSASASVTVSEPLPISITETHTDASSPTSNDASIDVTASGGSGTYQYSIDNTNFVSSGLFNGLGEGCYTVRVNDSNNCSFTSSPVCVSELVAGIQELDNMSVIIFPNPAKSYVTIRTMIQAKGTAELVSAEGKIVATQGLAADLTTIDLSRIAAGKYIVVLNTDKGIYKANLAVVK